jgi:hypothetical protein
MSHTPGQIAEYGTQEFNNNQSIYTILESGIYINPHGIQFKTDLYHKTEGYTPAGSCATWTREIWGYKIHQPDETTTGKFSINRQEIIDHWKTLTESKG